LSSLGLARKSITGGIREAQNAEEDKADQTWEANLPAVDKAGPRARRMAMSEVRLAGESPGPPQDQKKPAGK
jgi:hypothetical protein